MLNSCQFIGNLGRDPEVRSFANGGKIANLNLAVTETWKDRDTGERKERTEWIPVTLSGGLVDVAERYLRKGSRVYVSGQWKTRKWQDKDGNDRYSTECVVGMGGKMLMLDKAEGQSRGGGGSGPAKKAQQGGFEDDGFDDDDIPFISCDPRYDRRAH